METQVIILSKDWIHDSNLHPLALRQTPTPTALKTEVKRAFPPKRAINESFYPTDGSKLEMQSRSGDDK